MASLLMGNGINYLGNNVVGWEELLKSLISDMDKDNVIQLEEKPYLHVYEEIYSRGIKYKNTKESDLKDKIVAKLKNTRPNEYHTKIMQMNFEHILTTNYDYNLTPREPKKNKEREYSLKRYQEYNNKKVWHIHGELNASRSIMLGYDQYMKSIGHMQKYLKEKDSAIEETLNTWLDVFLEEDIYILGLTLDFGEIDLWWILSYRNRKILEGKKITSNKIVFINIRRQTKISKKENAKLSMLKAFDVTIKDFILEDLENNERIYHKAYDEIIEFFESELASKNVSNYVIMKNLKSEML